MDWSSESMYVRQTVHFNNNRNCGFAINSNVIPSIYTPAQ
jgi:hypothetical protein